MPIHSTIGPIRLTTFDHELAQTSDYKTVQQILLDLYYGGIVQKGSGYCISMSDMVRTLLIQKGIDTDIIECKLTILGQNPPGMTLIGHHGLRKTTNLNDADDIDTHVVCITKTQIPMLLDLSIFNCRPEIPFICERLNGSNVPNINDQSSDTIAKYEFDSSVWIYQTRETQRIPRQHQISIIDRIKTDIRVSNDIKWLKILNYLGISISLINFTVNLVIIYLTQSK